MTNISREELEALKSEFTKGTRVRLLELNDDYRYIPPNTEGTVRNVDDTGTIHVSWDNLFVLGVIYGVDRVEVI